MAQGRLKKYRHLVFMVISMMVIIGCAFRYTNVSKLSSDIDNLEYIQGELDYLNHPWKYYYWSWRKRRRWRKRRIEIRLRDDYVSYIEGEYLWENLYEEPFYGVMYEYDTTQVRIGYLSTEDPYECKIYSVEAKGIELVDFQGIKDDIKNERNVVLIAIILFGIVTIIFTLLFIKELSKSK